MEFKELGLEEYIVSALERQGITEPTEIQAKTIPLIKSGLDVVGKSQTGSGKTFAYGLPALENIDVDLKLTQVLIVCPTRELAVQVTDELRKITEYKEGCKVVPIFGGSSMDRQIQAIKKGAKIVVGTPGRIMDHLRRKTLKLHELKMLVLDEADEMLDMGFREDIETILKTTNDTHQTVMFSATMPKAILDITKTFMKTPTYVEVARGEEKLDIKQYFVNVGMKDKKSALKELLLKQKPEIAIIFCNTKRMVDDLQKLLDDEHINAVSLHGDMRQGERTRVMKSMKTGMANLLIATDVAARGIDINNVDVIYNYDLPNNTDYYTHRIGRTGRAGKSGIAYTLINTKQQLSDLIGIQKETNTVVEEYICSFTKEKDYKVIPSDREKRDTRNFTPAAKRPFRSSGDNFAGKTENGKFNRFDKKPADGKFNKFEKKDSGFRKFEKRTDELKPNNFDKEVSSDRDFNKANRYGKADGGSFNKFEKKPDDGKFNKFKKFEKKSDGGSFNKFEKKSDGGSFNKFEKKSDGGNFNKFEKRPDDGKFNKFDKRSGDTKFNKFEKKPDDGKFNKFKKFDNTEKRVEKDRPYDASIKSAQDYYTKKTTWTGGDNKGGSSYDAPRRSRNAGERENSVAEKSDNEKKPFDVKKTFSKSPSYGKKAYGSEFKPKKSGKPYSTKKI